MRRKLDDATEPRVRSSACATARLLLPKGLVSGVQLESVLRRLVQRPRLPATSTTCRSPFAPSPPTS